jgi:capsule polysaccharide export protein KpsC/LpsZ
MQKRVVHFGFNNPEETALIQRYAANHGCTYWWEGVKNDIFKAGDSIKRANMVVIWNGWQHGGPLATRLCKRRGIPVCYLEWGILPQSTTFIVDPSGFCADSILAKDLSWITDHDMELLDTTRKELQQQYPITPEGFVLVPLQIENDSQILYHSPYTCMEEFVEEVEAAYPDQRIVVRCHPQSNAERKFRRAEINNEGSFLEMAARASVVVGISSTTLYEAAILGVHVVAKGDHPLRIQPLKMREKVLAGLLALRIDRATGDLDEVLKRFNVIPLEEASPE